MADIDKTKYKEALFAVEELNPSAYVLAKAEQKVRDPNVEVDDIINILKNDTAITADIIRLSNSAFYGGASEYKDIKSAISKIGFSELLKMLSLTVSKSIMGNALKYYKMSDEEYLREAVINALIMESLSDHIDLDSQEAYTIGLLSVVGKTVINKILEVNDFDGDCGGANDLIAWEKSMIGFDHAYAGAMLLKSWEFPTDIVMVILNQFNPNDSEASEAAQFSLSLTRRLSIAIGNDLSREDYTFDDAMNEYMAKWSLSEDVVRACLTKASEKFDIVSSELGIK